MAERQKIIARRNNSVRFGKEREKEKGGEREKSKNGKSESEIKSRETK